MDLERVKLVGADVRVPLGVLEVFEAELAEPELPA
jgi:hypothetical protein